MFATAMDGSGITHRCRYGHAEVAWRSYEPDSACWFCGRRTSRAKWSGIGLSSPHISTGLTDDGPLVSPQTT